ncbi:hypothetical protein [Flavobacterium sp.]|uniref:hypothetical protein n=1 Tax=Flavobacterium sp. TaxID=239 RepID=UPI00263A0FDB|nr:hypothetical protein [Flavobacterium sp.]
MDSKKIDLEIFNQIQTMAEFENICANYNFLIVNNLIPECGFVRVLATMTFRKLIRVSNGD